MRLSNVPAAARTWQIRGQRHRIGAGPRDLLDVHVEALDQAVQGHSDERARTFVVEGRLLALEMMGLLVDYYRVGLRRRFVEGKIR